MNINLLIILAVVLWIACAVTFYCTLVLGKRADRHIPEEVEAEQCP